jgi:hypothetical protein
LLKNFAAVCKLPCLYTIVNFPTKQKDAAPEKPATTDLKSEITNGVVERHFCFSRNQKFIVLFPANIINICACVKLQLSACDGGWASRTVHGV